MVLFSLYVWAHFCYHVVMRALIALVMSVLLAGCVYKVMPKVSPRVTPAQPGVVTSEEMPAAAVACANDAQALSYAREQMAQMSPRICFSLAGENVYNRAYTLADTLLQAGSAVSCSICTRGNDVMLQLTYADNEVMLRAHRFPSYRAGLTDMQRRALAEAERVVSEVCRNYGTDYERALALHDYLVLKSTYKEELQGRDTANVTARLFETGYGVCDAYTRAYSMMLHIAGIDNMFVAGVAHGENHCWNLVRLQGNWVHVHCTYSDPMPDEPGRVYRTHFAMTDAIISHDHSWNRSNYPAATATQLYYPLRYAHFATVHELVAWARYHAASAQTFCITAYVDELSRFGHDLDAAKHLIARAHRAENAYVIRHFALEECLPGVIVCKIETPAL